MNARRLLALPVIALLAVACGDDDTPDVSTDGTAVEQGQDGTTITLTPSGDASTEDLDRAVDIIEQRLDALEAGTATVEVLDGSIEVVVPAEIEPALVTGVVGRTAELAFRPVLTLLPADIAPDCDPAGVDGAPDELLPQFDGPGDTPTLCYGLGPVTVGADSVASASAEMEPLGSWMVAVDLTDGPAGIDGFNEIAGACFAREASCPAGQLAIVLDDVVMSAPSIQQPTFDASGISISGDFTEQEAKDLALVLRFGALPVQLEVTDISEPG